MITGTPAFYDGQQGVQRLAPLAQRLATDFTTDPRFGQESLVGLGVTIRDLYAEAAESPERVRAVVVNVYVGDLARAVGGALGGKVGVAPRLFLKKFVDDVLDRVDQFHDFDPRQHYRLTVASSELTDVERNLAASVTGGPASADDVDLGL